MSVEELAVFDYLNGKIEVLTTSMWDEPDDGVRVLRSSSELTGFDFILVASETYIETIRANDSILLFLWAIRKLGQELLNNPSVLD